MSSKNVAIRVRDLSKMYQIGRENEKHSTLAETMLARLKNPLKRAARDEFWALREVNFEVQKGDVVGIIGRNGAGKSTLLKVLSRITEPTKGKVELFGRVGSLLEVGTGFHPELTGRENIFLNGAILGMRRAEIARQFDAIVAFSEVEKFLDTPVKRYSSGMYVRLAFAVAAHLDPEILIVDEVLSVGDTAFQNKCLGKMQDLTHEEGRTIFFVSHNMNVVRTLCSKVLYLNSGAVEALGPTTEMIELYQDKQTGAGTGAWVNKSEGTTDIARLAGVEVRSVDTGELVSAVRNTEPVEVALTVDVKRAHTELKVGFELVYEGLTVFRSECTDIEAAIPVLGVGRHQLKCRIPGGWLHFGRHGIRPKMSLHCQKDLLKCEDVVVLFDVELDTGVSRFHQTLNEQNQPGAVFPLLKWSADN